MLKKLFSRIHETDSDVNFHEKKNNGIFVCKIFMGSTFKEIITESKLIFKQTKVFKPTSSRKDSKESFIICNFL